MPTHLRKLGKGKCLDLSKAYKQLAVFPEHRPLAVIAVRQEDGRDGFVLVRLSHVRKHSSSVLVQPSLPSILVPHQPLALESPPGSITMISL